MVEALLEAGFLEDSSDLLDAEVRAWTDALAQRTLEKLYPQLIEELIERYKAKGMSPHRHTQVTFTTVVGPVTVSSPYLYERKTRSGARPLKEELGLYHGARTPAVEEALAEFGTHDSFRRAQQRFERHYPAKVGDSAPRDVTEEAGRDAETFVAERLEEMAATYQLPPIERTRWAEEMVTQADGVMVRTGEWMAAEEALEHARDEALSDEEIARIEQRIADGKTTVRLQRWRELHSGLVRRKDQKIPLVLARCSTRQEVIGDLWAMGVSLGLHFDTQTLAIGDGGGGIKEGFERHFARVDYLLDWRHLEVDHFQETARGLGMDEPMAKRWARQCMEDVARGEQGALLARLKERRDEMAPERDDDDAEAPTGYESLRKLIGYLEKFYHCMEYDTWKEDGWPIGSSEVESLHKRLIQRRLKLPGACWSEENLGPMCALRTISLNEGWWEEFWTWKHQRRQDQSKMNATA